MVMRLGYCAGPKTMNSMSKSYFMVAGIEGNTKQNERRVLYMRRSRLLSKSSTNSKNEWETIAAYEKV